MATSGNSANLAGFEVPLTPDGEEIELSVEAIEKLEDELLLSSEVFFFLVVVLQIALFQLKKRFPAHFNNGALFCLWAYPLLMFTKDEWYFAKWVYFLLWTTWSVKTMLIVKKAWTKPLPVDTPEQVYTWFLRSHTVCYWAWGCSFYVIFLVDVDAGGLMLFLSLYFGVLIRDFAEVASMNICNSIGYSKYETPPVNLCALCGVELKATLDIMLGKTTEEEEDAKNKTIKLSCSHEFHERCIRGWAIVGKKDTCPFCFEKIDLKSILPESRWNSKSLSIFWVRLLSVLRFLIVWNPIVVYTTLALMKLFHVTTIKEFDSRHIKMQELERMKHELQQH